MREGIGLWCEDSVHTSYSQSRRCIIVIGISVLVDVFVGATHDSFTFAFALFILILTTTSGACSPGFSSNVVG